MNRDPEQALPLLHSLSSAVGIRAIYPPSHPRVTEAVNRLVKAFLAC